MNKSIFLLALLLFTFTWAQNQNVLQQSNIVHDCRLQPGEKGAIDCKSIQTRCFSVSCNQATGECDLNPTLANGCPAIPDSYYSQKSGKFRNQQNKANEHKVAKNTTETRDVHSNLIKNGGFENTFLGSLLDWYVISYPVYGPYFQYSNGNSPIDIFGNVSPQPAKGEGEAVVAFQGFCPWAAALFQEFDVNMEDCVTDLEISFKLSLHNNAPFNRFTINELLYVDSLTDLCDASQFFTASLFNEYYLLETFYSTSFSDGPANFGYKKFKVSLEKVLQPGQLTGTATLTLGFVAKATQGTFNIAIDDVHVKAVCHKKD